MSDFIKSQDSKRVSNIKDLDISIIHEVNKLLIDCCSFDFDIFELDRLVGRRLLSLMSHEIFERYLLFEELVNEDKFKSFINAITHGYTREIVYHNDIHAADVLQTIFVIVEKGNLILVNITLI